MRTPARLDRLENAEPELLEPVRSTPAHAERLPMVAIVGRPNVGKSTLFNRLAGSRRALVHERPGMTRDRLVERIEYDGRPFLCVDTGGLDVAVDDPLYANVVEQARLAIDEADVIVYLTAVGEDRHPAEPDLIDLLRRAAKPVIVGVNKCDNPRLEIQAAEFFSYGFERIYPLSALHGRGVDDLAQAVFERIDALGPEAREHVSGGIAVAVVGRQNVGKSTLINRILGEERHIAGDLPGTTRDAVDSTVRGPGGDVFTIIDTAGIRRRGKIERGIEKITVISSMMAMRRADVAVLLIDAAQGLTAQDAHIADYCVEEGLACILAVNKWDLVEKDHRTADQFTKNLERAWPFMRYVPVVYISAKTGQRADRILELAKRVYLNAERRIATPALNDLVRQWTARKSPPLRRGRPGRIRYAAQTGVHPPTFTFFVNDPKMFHFSYRRYLGNRLRESENFEGTPLRLNFKRSSEKRPPRGGSGKRKP